MGARRKMKVVRGDPQIRELRRKRWTYVQVPRSIVDAGRSVRRKQCPNKPIAARGHTQPSGHMFIGSNQCTRGRKNRNSLRDRINNPNVAAVIVVKVCYVVELSALKSRFAYLP